MFKRKISLDELVKDTNLLSKMSDSDVYQVSQVGQDVKIILTQEHYFNIMSRLETLEGSNKRTKYDADKLVSDFEYELVAGKNK